MLTARPDCAHIATMRKQSINSKLISIGISPSYASEIVAGIRPPSLKLAVRIYKELGVKYGPITGATKSQIAAIAKVLEGVPA